ncbi:sugar phosphate isomerase/epimerase family protein [Streptomyces sp. NPDC101237]|uniref:sugar phosphate isomerase/epimerase family protein n=1 Tax=Streptomyces sp. NPDC101237 TaxID=3366139 RepID=UPI0037F95DBC
MKLGFLTACLPDVPLPELAACAADHGYRALEAAAWPATGNRPFTASHLAAESFDRAEAEQVAELLHRHGITPSSLAHHDNPLHPDPEERVRVHAHLRRIVDTLDEGGYDGVLSVEHEDPVWSGDRHRTETGLEIARRTRAPLLAG